MSEALLLVGRPETVPELRHEVRAAVPDEVIWLLRGDEETAWAFPFDASPLADGGTVDDVRSVDELGILELRRDPAVSPGLLVAELTLRAVTGSDVRAVRVPPGFPVGVADRLRSGGVEVTVDPERFTERRRAKRAWELDGMRAAGRAAQAALLEAASAVREGLDGLTCERLRERMVRVLLDEGAESEEVLIQTGPAVAGGHDLGFGPVVPDFPLQIDIFPRHRASGMYIDMSRTWVPGTPSAEAVRLWEHVWKAHQVALRGARPGVDDLFLQVAHVFEGHGHPTQNKPNDGLEFPDRGFIPSLGHGVGLDVHEPPRLGIPGEPLLEGETVAIEPSLGYEGVGFVMVEDTVIVGPDGAEHLFDPLPYGLEVPGAG